VPTAEALRANDRLVERLIAEGCLWSRPLIDAFRATPRHRFLDRVFHFQRRSGRWIEIDLRAPGRAGLRLLYSDRALITRLSEARPPAPISSSSQPSLMALILEDLRLRPGLRLLEIGAGTGYNAALMAHASGRVVSLDVDRRVLAEATEHLKGFPDRRVELVHGDGRLGWEDGAPFDRILVTAATPDLEPAWLDQAGDGGWVEAPLALAPGLAYMVRGVCRRGVFSGRLRRPAYFMPLRAESGPEPPDPTAAGALPSPASLTAAAPPWGAEDERRSVFSNDMLQALAFLGWLHGLTVSQTLFGERRLFYGVADLVRGRACWMGRSEWRVSGSAGQELGRRLWQEYLDAGGPRPTEFRLQAAARGSYFAESDGQALRFRREGPRCEQLWELAADRMR
jgi:protein-L-isoaspartate(D-aspartate) O-methyltransferase